MEIPAKAWHNFGCQTDYVRYKQNMKIEFSIISRGTMLVYYNNKKLKISGELTFSPLVFYASIDSIKVGDANQDDYISQKEKEDIISFISNESQKEGMTKVVFE